MEYLRLLVAKQEIDIARLKKGYWVEEVGAMGSRVLEGSSRKPRERPCTTPG